MVDTFGSSKYSNEEIADAIIKTVDLRPAAIISRFKLRRPIYAPLAAYGHIGREDLGAPWEETDITKELTEALS